MSDSINPNESSPSTLGEAISRITRATPPVDTDRLGELAERNERLREQAEAAVARELAARRELHESREFLRSVVDKAKGELTPDQEAIFDALLTADRSATFEELRNHVPVWGDDTSDDAVIRALKRLKKRLRQQCDKHWDFSIREAHTVVVWTRSTGIVNLGKMTPGGHAMSIDALRNTGHQGHRAGVGFNVPMPKTAVRIRSIFRGVDGEVAIV